MSAKTAKKKISRDDIEDRLRALQGDVTERVEDSRLRVLEAAVAGGILLLLVAFLLGRRRGRKRTTVVEIRRL